MCAGTLDCIGRGDERSLCHNRRADRKLELTMVYRVMPVSARPMPKRSGPCLGHGTVPAIRLQDGETRF